MRPSTIVLLTYSFCGQLVALLYGVWGVPLPAILETLYPLAFLWIISWWFVEDTRTQGQSWPLDMGMFLYSGWIFFIPYYLFKTRGVKGFVGILAFAGVNIAAWIAALVFVNM
jgi:hypothetical protein